MDNWQYLVAAYTVVWTVLTLYVLRTALKQKATERRLDDIESTMEKDGGGA